MDPHAARADDALPWIVADVGGTNARVGWVLDRARGVEHVRTLPASAHAGLREAIEAYLADTAALAGHARPRRAAIAIAGPTDRDEIAFTNSSWRFTRAGLQRELGLDALVLLNDFEAQALSLPRLTPAQWRPIGGTALPSGRGRMAVIGPGTGLGVGSVVETRSGWVPLPGEGGHVTLAPADDFESALLAHTREQFAHVSAERYLSGVGLPTLHEAVRAVLALQGESERLDATAIVQRGLAGDPACARTLDTFCAMLGGLAGNLALTVGASGGVFIGGGIVPRLGERFFASDFRLRFEAKGRFASYLAAIPTVLIVDTLAALRGAMLALEQHAPAL